MLFAQDLQGILRQASSVLNDSKEYRDKAKQYEADRCVTCCSVFLILLHVTVSFIDITFFRELAVFIMFISSASVVAIAILPLVSVKSGAIL